MASQSAILRAAKAVPGGARPTMPPQGANLGPNIGQISPLAAQLANERGYANAYGPFLPRPASTFTQGAFGPFSPILPVPVDEPPPGGEMPDARRWEFNVGWNLPVGQPGSEGIKLASFGTLRSLADIYSIARTCIQRRKDEIAGLDWDIVPTHEAAKAYQGDHEAMRDFGQRRAEAVKFFRKPDPNYFTLSSWLKAILEEIFVFDALTLMLKPKRGTGLGRGVLGSDLDCIELINGATVRPLLDLHGATPRPPAPAYQQYLYGVPRSDFMTMVTGRDIEEAGMGGDALGAFTTDQMLYLPTNPRSFTPYGFGPTEQALIVIMTGLQKQAYQLDYYREGTVPAVYISPGDANITPNQIRELQDALNAYAGDPAWHHKIIVLPPGARVEPQRAQDLADQFDEIIMNNVAMTYDVDPMSLGIIPKVSTVASPFAAREMAQASRTVHERTSTKPLLKFICDIMNTVLHVIAGQDDMKFTFAGLDEAQDQAATTDLLVKQVQNGIRSVDEARGELELPPWGLPETSGPVVFTQMGPMPFEWMPGADMQGASSGPYSGSTGSPSSEAAGEATATSGTGAAAGTPKPIGVHHPPSSRPVGTHNPRLGLPTGSRRQAEVPPERAGRTVGSTPAHSAAQGHMGVTSGRGRAAKAELEALGRHLRKGRDIRTWRPRFIPGVTLATIAEDLTKGLTVNEAVAGALITLPPGSVETVVKAGGPKGWAGWAHDQDLARVYTGKIAAAFGKALRKAAALIRRWWAGTLAVTRQVLAGLIRDLIAQALRKVLRALWREAWHLGHRSALEATGTGSGFGNWTPGDRRTIGTAVPETLKAWIASHGENAVTGMSGTRVGEIEQAIADTAASGGAPADVITRLESLLMVPQRAPMIAGTEIGQAQGEAAMQHYRQVGVAYKEWVTEDGPCPVCAANAAEGPIPLDAAFQSGALTVPQHPRCRCAVLPAGAPDVEKARRSVGLNGQEYWPAGSDQYGTAPGQGALGAPVPHDGNGGYRPGGVAGVTAGGEPLRWNGGEVTPRIATAPDDADDADWPGEREVGPLPGARWPATYMDGYWPQGGHGTQQAPAMPVPGDGRIGRPPNAVGKNAADLTDPNPVEAEHVIGQMRQNYPEKALGWMRDARWIGPVRIPQDRINTSDEDSWAASHEPKAVDRFAKAIKDGTGHTNPVVMVQKPGDDKTEIIDGHHRTLAYRKLGKPVLAYVGFVPRDDGPWDETHSAQIHQGEDPANKAFSGHGFEDVAAIAQRELQAAAAREVYGEMLYGKADKPPVAAGLAVRAADTGRILMLQRAIDPGGDDKAAGFWEFPGGRLDAGEDALEAARREWAEETGCEVPDGDLEGIWNSGNGRYRGFVHTVPSEDAVPIHGDRDDVTNPDDPDGDHVEALAWWDPAQLKENPAVRPELLEDVKRIRRALKSAQTPMLEATPHLLGPHGLWHTPDKHVPFKQKLPNYVEHIAAALMRDQGLDESTAVAYAINAIKRWAAGDLHWGRGKVTPEVQAASRRALAEWEALRASHGG